MATLRARLRKLTTLTMREWFDLVQAQWTLLHVLLLVRTRPAGHMFELGSQAAPMAEAGPPRHRTLALRLSRAVTRAAVHGLIRPTCLVRAVALQRMLISRGVRGSRICVGVQLEHENFAAHAWVQYEDLLLGDSVEHVQGFTALTNARLARQR